MISYPVLRKTTLNYFFLVFLFYNSLYAQKIVKGTYIGKDVYIQNIMQTGDSIKIKGYCIDSLYVNDSLMFVSPQTSAFKVDLSFLNINDRVNIKIIHKENCVPKVLNDNDILFGIDFKFNDIKISEKKIEWYTEGEANGSFFITYHLWLDEWLALDTVFNKGSSVKSSYQLPIYNLSGENKYKISYYSNDSTLVEFKEREYFSHKSPITFKPKRVNDYIYLSEKTRFYVIDKSKKKILLSGISDKVDCSSLRGGRNKYYYLIIDKTASRFLKI